jgi:tRNA (guanine37-N1)-methyltransferase
VGEAGGRAPAPTLIRVRIAVITLFPEFFESPLATSLVGRAISDGRLAVEMVDLRRWGKGTHRQVDDTPFGGGPGMVLMVEPLAEALATQAGSHKVLLGAAGRRLVQADFDRWSRLPSLSVVCGRYEGVDERVSEHLVDEEVSLGDYVLLGGEIGALAIIEGVTRLLPGVVGNPGSIDSESYRHGLVEEPQYTRPADFRGWEVPEVLTSGDHGRIEAWRRAQRLERTRQRRPDLLGEMDDPDYRSPPGGR